MTTSSPDQLNHSTERKSRFRRRILAGSGLASRTPGPSASAGMKRTPACLSTVRSSFMFAAVIGACPFVPSARRIVLTAKPVVSANSATETFRSARAARS